MVTAFNKDFEFMVTAFVHRAFLSLRVLKCFLLYVFALSSS